MTISGRNGRDLGSQWAEGARAHLGMAVPGFPNMFLIYGPNTNLGSSSVIQMIEQQARYIRQVVGELARSGRARAFEIGLPSRRPTTRRFSPGWKKACGPTATPGIAPPPGG